MTAGSGAWLVHPGRPDADQRSREPLAGPVDPAEGPVFPIEGP
jgi:hypothetical protein